MLLAKAVEKAKEVTGQRCECGVYMTRFEYLEYGKCWLCKQDDEEEKDE